MYLSACFRENSPPGYAERGGRILAVAELRSFRPSLEGPGEEKRDRCESHFKVSWREVRGV